MRADGMPVLHTVLALLAMSQCCPYHCKLLYFEEDQNISESLSERRYNCTIEFYPLKVLKAEHLKGKDNSIIVKQSTQPKPTLTITNSPSILNHPHMSWGKTDIASLYSV